MILFSVIFLSLLFLAPQAAVAWGPGVHLAQGSRILMSLDLISPVIASLIQAHPLDYLYGLIAADIFIGKGNKPHEHHCHNWDTGFALFEHASLPAQQAFVWGYLSHLAGDVIAHNYYIPLNIKQRRLGKKLGHVYWEVLADALVDKSSFRHGQDLINLRHSHDDAVLNETLKKKWDFFRTKKYIYKKSIELNNIKMWTKRVNKMSTNLSSMDQSFTRQMMNLSYDCVLNFLICGQKSVILKYDPVGSQAIHESETMMFKIPDELLTIKNRNFAA